MAVEHWMTFGKFAEQEFFRYPTQDTYTGVVINANILSHAPGGIAGFISGKTRTQFPYLIDPLTHAFQHSPSVILNNKNEIKSSIQNLIKEYGTLIQNYAGKRPLTPSDFSDEDLTKEFVNCCLTYQVEKLTNAIKDSENFKYFDAEEINKPYAIIAPYFYMDEMTYPDWVKINLNLIQFSISDSVKHGYKHFAAIIINQGILLENAIIDDIIIKYSNIDLDGYILWIDELDETNSNRSTLKGLLKLAEGLRKNNTRDLINLHGGYFSVLSSSPTFEYPAFTGIAHGPEYGEFRKIIPVGGGIPVSKFYIKQLHKRVKYKETLRYYSLLDWLITPDLYYNHICSCQECKNVIGSDPNNFVKFGEAVTKKVRRGNNYVSMEYALQETKVRCLKHYLWKKDDEYKFIQSATKEDILTDLVNGHRQFEQVAGQEEINHLQLWEEICRSR